MKNELTDEQLKVALDAARVGTFCITHSVTRQEMWLTEGSMPVRKFADAVIAAHEAIQPDKDAEIAAQAARYSELFGAYHEACAEIAVLKAALERIAALDGWSHAGREVVRLMRLGGQHGSGGAAKGAGQVIANADMRVMLFAMVMDMCADLGMSEKEALQMFHPSNIKGGYAILEERKEKR